MDLYRIALLLREANRIGQFLKKETVRHRRSWRFSLVFNLSLSCTVECFIICALVSTFEVCFLTHLISSICTLASAIALVAIATVLLNIDYAGAPAHGNLPSRTNC